MVHAFNVIHILGHREMENNVDPILVDQDKSYLEMELVKHVQIIQEVLRSRDVSLMNVQTILNL